MERQRMMMVVSKRLLIFAGLSLLLTMAVFGATLIFEKKFMVSFFCFECGLIGGFVSIQQRLQKINDEELAPLAESWAIILVIPIFGGIFALVLYMLFLSGLLEGQLFPKFSTAFGGAPAAVSPPGEAASAPLVESLSNTDRFRIFFSETYPSNSEDFAKFAFWSFVAGFSERFVPLIIQRVSSDAK